jgi:hypothetical protein
MQILEIDFADSFAWLLTDADPAQFPLSNLENWELLNPRLYQGLETAYRVGGAFNQIREQEYFGLTQGLILVSGSRASDLSGTDFEPATLIQALEKFLSKLRILTGQATLPQAQSFISMRRGDIGAIPEFVPDVLASSYIREYSYKVCITGKHILSAALASEESSVPTHETLLLDAIKAHESLDFATAILYAAMSMEVSLGFAIENAFSKIAPSTEDPRFRFIKRVQPGNIVVVKDPIYERLKSTRNSFAIRLQELTLYVLRRPLLVENESLYQRAKSLYDTRNKLAHEGSIDEAQAAALLSIDRAGSNSALETALKLQTWLGLRSDIPLPSSNFVSFRGEGMLSIEH